MLMQSYHAAPPDGRRAGSQRPACLLLLAALLAARGLLLAAFLAAAGGLAQRFADLHDGLAQCLGLLLDGLRGVALQHAAQVSDGGVDVLHDVGRQVGLVLVARLLRRVDEGVRLVLGLDRLLARLVLLGVRLRVAHHLLDLVLVQAAARLDGDLLLLVGGLVLGGDVHNAVGINVKSHLDLRNATRGGRDANQVKVAQHLVVGGHFTLALQHFDAHLGLVVGGGGEHLRFLGGDGGVAVDEAREDAAHGLNAQAQGRHVQQQDVLHIAAQHAALDGGAHGDHLVGVNAPVGVLVEDFLDDAVHLGHAGHAAHQQHLVDVIGAHAGILHAVAAGLLGALQQGVHQALELGAGDGGAQMLGARGICRDERQVDVRLRGGGQLALGLLARLAQALHRQLVAAQVDARLLLELVGEVLQQRVVKVLAAQEGVAVGGLDLKHAAADLQDGHVKGAAAQIVHGHEALLLVRAVAQRRGGGLVDDAQHVQPRNLARVLGGLALTVIEVGRHGDDGLGDGAAQVRLGSFLHLGEREGANLAGGVLLAAGLHPSVAVGCLDDLVRHHLGLLLGLGVVVHAAY
mmetsp:Transcript_27894/g.70115  ORF Transcript_27894/g.70115 Transcript_27894/m.70115 type:complete len:574 (+) Transcript_27894:58-1779(+)